MKNILISTLFVVFGLLSTGCATLEAAKQDSSVGWEKTKEASAKAWEATKEGSSEAWKATKKAVGTE